MLAVQDELTDQIVATVADPAGIVVRTLAAPADRKGPEELTPYEAVLRYFLFQQRISEQDHLITRTALERAVELDPGYADAWTSLSLIYQQEFMNNLNPRPQPLQRGLETAQRAVDLDPTSSRAHFAMAQVHYFMRDVGAFLVHARRAIELNPRNTDTMAMVGIMMGYSGDWVALAISHAQLGDEAAAKHAAAELLRVWPNVERDYYQMGLVNWAYSQPELIEHVNEGLRKAGVNLQVPDVVKN
jgi:tetratricopeptide (TPR) repeat protein